MMEEDSEMADPRISGMGRKRNLQDVTQQQDGDPAKDSNSSDAEFHRPQKRFKHPGEVSAVPKTEEHVVISPASPLLPASSFDDRAASSKSPVGSRGEHLQASDGSIDEADAPIDDPLIAGPKAEVLHALPVSQTEIVEVTEGEDLTLRGAESQSSQSLDSTEHVISTREAPVSFPSASEKIGSITHPTSQDDVNFHKPVWNKGVQSGLRTSFATKTRSNPRNSGRPAPVLDDESQLNLLSKAPLASDDSDRHVLEGNNESDPSEQNDLDGPTSDSLEMSSDSPAPVSTNELAPPFRRLSKKQKSKLSLAERMAYNVADKANKTERALHSLLKNTEKAEEVLAREKKWPVSHKAVLKSINEGRTFYARYVREPLRYFNSVDTFNLFPVWDEEGKPIKAQDFSFNRFAPAFIRQNKDKANSIGLHDLRAAFSWYCKRGYYYHLKANGKPLLATVSAPDALDLDQALQRAGLSGKLSVMRPDIVAQQYNNPSFSEDTVSRDANHLSTPPTDFSARTSFTAVNSTLEPFVVLTKKAKEQLPPSELAVYEGKLAQHQENERKTTLARVEAATAEADKAIKLAGKWPLPKRYESISDDIAQGNTFYPQIPKKFRHYRKGAETYDIREIFDASGVPIKAQDFSFNSFSVHFLKQNRAKDIDKVSMSHLKGAFGLYCNTFYRHVLSISNLMQSTEAHDALTLREAKERAGFGFKILEPREAPTPLLASNTRDQAIADGGRQTVSKHVDANSSIKEPEPRAGHNSIDTRIDGRSDVQSSVVHGNRAVILQQLSEEAQKTQRQGSIVEVTRPDKLENDPTLSIGPIARGRDSVAVDALPQMQEDIEKGKSVVKDVEFVDDLLLQQRYFPAANTHSIWCLACAGIGHASRNCPALECTICVKKGDHSNLTCPNSARCRKCRQRGHTSTACPEKLLATKAEASPCDVCGSEDHLEGVCHFIWRSFAPPQEVKKVQGIPIDCYSCGTSGHFGTECGILTRRPLSGMVTWTTSNAQKYIDSTSRNRALSAGIDYSISKPTNQFSIKGMGSVTNSYIVDDSEEDGEFIRPKISNTAVRGHIRFEDTSRGHRHSLDRAPYQTRSIQSPRLPAMNYNGVYDNGFTPRQMPSDDFASYQPSANFSSYNLGSQFPDRPANSMTNAVHKQHLKPGSRSSSQNQVLTAEVATQAANSQVRGRKKEKKPRKRKPKGN